MEMYLDLSYSLVRACAETMMFLGCSSLLITSSTAAQRTQHAVTAKDGQCTICDDAAPTGSGALVLTVLGVCTLYSTRSTICKAGLCGLKPMSEDQPGFWLQHEDARQGNGFMFTTIKLSSLTSSVHTIVEMLTAKTGPDTAVQSCMHLPHMSTAGLNGTI